MDSDANAPTAPEVKPRPNARMPVGVIVERRTLAHPGQEFAWRPVAVEPEALAGTPWSVRRDKGARVEFFAGVHVIELAPSETFLYQHNLDMAEPSIYVVLRFDRAVAPHGVKVALVTASPADGEAYMASGEDIVERVPMPETLRAWLADYIAAYPPVDHFKKRKRHRQDPNRGFGKGGQIVGGGEHGDSS